MATTKKKSTRACLPPHRAKTKPHKPGEMEAMMSYTDEQLGNGG